MIASASANSFSSSASLRTLSRPISSRPGTASGGTRPRRPQQDMIRLMTPQYVIDQIGIDGHLLAGLLRPGMMPFDQPGDHRDIANSPPQHGAFRQPRSKIM